MSYITFQIGDTLYEFSYDRIRTIDELIYDNGDKALKLLFKDGEQFILNPVSVEIVNSITQVMHHPDMA